MLRWTPRALLLLALAPLAHAAHAAEPAVARPHFVAGAEPRAGGSAFFVAAPGEVGVAAVTTAHGFALSDLARASEVRFELAGTRAPVTVSSRLHAAPGRPFTEPGAQLRDDFLIFALDLAPRGVRVLPLCEKACAAVGQRVRVLGAPANGGADEDDVFGQITRTGAGEIEVLLDVPADLRGWGGGPVLRQPGGEVIGLLEAQWPDDDGLRIGVAPLDSVRPALAHPLDAGLGRPFASFAKDAPPRAAAPGAARAAPPGSARAAPPGAAGAPADEDAGPAPLDDSSTSGALLGRAEPPETKLHLTIEHPTDGGIVADAQGVFVAGRALALSGELRRYDVVLVLDTSDSTRAASGVDVNQNGVVGEDRGFGFWPTTDPGDSILAAEVAAARRVLGHFDPRSTRVSVVTFAGTPLGQPGTFVIGGSGDRPTASTEQPLTSDYARVEQALERVLARGPEGFTNMTEGLRMAVRELKGFRGSVSKADPGSAKFVLFFTDGQPTLPYDNDRIRNERSVLRAASQARRAGVIVHSFALGPEALDRPVAAVEMARISGGRFTPVRTPGDIVQVVEGVSFANLDRLTVRNRSLDAPALELLSRADGSFGALVPVQPGRNVIEVYAHASDGTEARTEITVEFLAGANVPAVPAELTGLRNQLLERRIVSLRRDRIETERERAEEVRRSLEVEIERERAAAEESVSEQRRELEIEPEAAP